METTNAPTTAIFLKKGKLLQQVTAEQAQKVWDLIRDEAMNNGLGNRDTPTMFLYDGAGRKIGYVSWNSSIILN